MFGDITDTRDREVGEVYYDDGLRRVVESWRNEHSSGYSIEGLIRYPWYKRPFLWTVWYIRYRIKTYKILAQDE